MVVRKSQQMSSFWNTHGCLMSGWGIPNKDTETLQNVMSESNWKNGDVNNFVTCRVHASNLYTATEIGFLLLLFFSYTDKTSFIDCCNQAIFDPGLSPDVLPRVHFFTTLSDSLINTNSEQTSCISFTSEKIIHFLRTYSYMKLFFFTHAESTDKCVMKHTLPTLHEHTSLSPPTLYPGKY